MLRKLPISGEGSSNVFGWGLGWSRCCDAVVFVLVMVLVVGASVCGDVSAACVVSCCAVVVKCAFACICAWGCGGIGVGVGGVGGGAVPSAGVEGYIEDADELAVEPDARVDVDVDPLRGSRASCASEISPPPEPELVPCTCICVKRSRLALRLCSADFTLDEFEFEVMGVGVGVGVGMDVDACVGSMGSWGNVFDRIMLPNPLPLASPIFPPPVG